MDSKENFVRNIVDGESDLDRIMATLDNEASTYFPISAIDDVCYDDMDSKDICHSTEIELNSSSETVAPTGNVPSMKAFTGQYNFTMNLSSTDRASWVYSSLLNQVFIDMDKVLMVQFHMSTMMPGMFIRALPVYSSMDNISLPVIRCTVHALEDDPGNVSHSLDGECLCMDYRLAGHVLRMQGTHAIYSYDRHSQRHSVKFAVIQPQPGSSFIEVPYYFTCKTSCIRGMQRRAINVVFTLESHNGLVMGRQILPVKICSCPKRDKQRMERAREEEKDSPPTKRFMTPADVAVKTEPESPTTENNEENLKVKMRKTINEVRQSLRAMEAKLDAFEALL